jgi:DNA (cytosine-5)-methyltransferase 1
MATYGVKLHRSDALRLGRHPDGCPDEAAFADWCKGRKAAGELLAVDLFSGAGGLSLGLELAGWTVAASVDHDLRALETHQQNFPGLALDVDLGDDLARDRLIALLKSAEIDLIAGGPPCQPFSRAGRSKIRSLVNKGSRDAHDHRKELWKAYLEIVLAIKPRAVLMENVPDMALGDDFLVVRTIVDELEGLGYLTQVQLADAWRYGVPQHRKRLIVLARRDAGQFSWPEAGKNVTVRDAIFDLPPLNDPVGAREMQLAAKRAALLPSQRGYVSDFAKEMRFQATDDLIFDHMSRAVREDDKATFQMMDSKTLYSDIPLEMRRYKADTFDDKYKRLDWDQLSRTITAHIAKDGYWYIHPEEHRTLSVREAARIQTFPDHFRFAGTRSDAFRQIGNAVPPLLGKAAGQALAPQQSSREEVGVSKWLGARTELANWAEKQRRSEHWFLLPGSLVTPTVAAAATLLSRRQDIRSLVGPFQKIKGLQKFSARELRDFADSFEDPRIAKALEPLSPLTRKQNIWRDPGQLAQELEIRGNDLALFQLLSGTDVMLTAQTSLRVAARVAGTSTDKSNRLSDGRIDLARLMGGGKDAPLRMAALRLVGATKCRVKEPFCEQCPLLQWCNFAKERPGSQTLF